MNEEERARALAQQQQSDVRMLAKLAIGAVVILSGAGVLGLAVRIFVAASGFGG